MLSVNFFQILAKNKGGGGNTIDEETQDLQTQDTRRGRKKIIGHCSVLKGNNILKKLMVRAVVH